MTVNMSPRSRRFSTRTHRPANAERSAYFLSRKPRRTLDVDLDFRIDRHQEGRCTPDEDVRPIRAETRATLVRSIAVGRRWLQEIVDGSSAGPDEIAARESCSRRHVMMMISLAFLAPDLVRTAMNGRLPRGIGVTRLTDAPIEWSRQWHMLGL